VVSSSAGVDFDARNKLAKDRLRLSIQCAASGRHDRYGLLLRTQASEVDGAHVALASALSYGHCPLESGKNMKKEMLKPDPTLWPFDGE
jgi:hypothetical protein